MTRAVLDPSVLISSFIGRPDAAPGRVIRAWRDGRFTLVVSPALLGELADVLRRPKLARWSGEDRGAAFVAALAARSEHHEDPVHVEPAGLRDPDDEYLVALARRSAADFLVSLDLDLLEAPLADLTVLAPAAFLDRARRRAADAHVASWRQSVSRAVSRTVSAILTCGN